MILIRIAGTLEPELLEALAQAVPEGLAQAKMPEPLGLWKLLKKLSSQDTRRAMTAMICMLESLGKSLGISQRDRPSAKLFTKDSSTHSK